MPGPHLTESHRSLINIGKLKNSRVDQIAEEAEKHLSTIYRELKRARVKGEYCPITAQNDAATKKKAPRKKTKDSPETRAFIQQKLELKMSPECISGRQKHELELYQGRLAARGGKAIDADPEPLQIGTSLIYQIIGLDRQEGGKMFELLPRHGKRYTKHTTSGSRKKAGRLPVKPEQEISERPVSLETRKSPGHQEIDLVFCGGTILFTGVDRFSRLAFVRAIPCKEADVVAEEIIEFCHNNNVRTITTDRGLEWAGLQGVLDKLAMCGIIVNAYFCKPYHSWEKGSIENLNGVIRRYYPKGVDFPWHAGRRAEAREVERMLNRTPRKILGYKTPEEVEAGWSRAAMEEHWLHGMRPPMKAA